jgi:SWI/SNF-related matrix-associated actin-dependent regulator of chromatin subfamily D
VEDQPWQSDTPEVDAFDFSTNIDSSYRVKIEGRLLDDEEDEQNSDSEDEDVEQVTNGDAMDQDGAEEKKPKKKSSKKQYKLSHFFKAMTVDFDKNKGKDTTEQSIEWKKPSVAPNAANPPTAADFDQLEFKRGGDENTNITINLTRDENPERFALKQPLIDILDTTEATRAEAVYGIWEYIKAHGLQDEDEKRSFECDGPLQAVSNPALVLITLLTVPDLSSRKGLHSIYPRTYPTTNALSPTHSTSLHHSS